MYGGVLAWACDDALTGAVWSTLDAETIGVGPDFRVRFLRPVPLDVSRLDIHGEITHTGRSLGFPGGRSPTQQARPWRSPAAHRWWSQVRSISCRDARPRIWRPLRGLSERASRRPSPRRPRVGDSVAARPRVVGVHEKLLRLGDPGAAGNGRHDGRGAPDVGVADDLSFET